VKRERGFTLAELMVTLTIMGILFAIGVPSYRNVTKSNRLSAEINGLLGDLQFARSEAIREGQQVSVCVPTTNPPPTAGATCSAAGTDWKGGWVVWVDFNGDATITPNEVLRIQAPITSGDTVVPSNALASLNFNREGFALGFGGTTFVAKDATATAKFTHCLQVTTVGTVRTMTPTTDTTGTCPTS